MTEPDSQPTTTELIERFQRALGARAQEQAEQLGEMLSVRDPGNEDVVAFLIARALSRRDVPRALSLGRNAIRARPESARLHFQLGTALEAAGDRVGARDAFRQARERDPDLMVAALWQADQELALGRLDDAIRSQLQALAVAERKGQLQHITKMMPAVRLRVERAMGGVQNARRAAIETALAPMRASVGNDALSRIDRALATVYGQPAPKPSHPLQLPTFLWLPDLTDQPWFEREQFPFLQKIEQATDRIREELLAVLADESDLSPYVDMPESAPAATVWRSLNRSPKWSSYHLYRHGERIEAHCRRCPQTVALLESLPIMRVPGHSPEIMFSVLKPRTHIPPHTGVINGRLTVHLPLIVPENCGALRVGGESRKWRVGECLIFDDSFFHEAWNGSDETRVVLIFDIWDPSLAEAERIGLAAAIAAIGEFDRRYGGENGTREG